MINLFPKNKVPFLIWAPPYTHTSSGVRTLHLLCHALNEAGEKAYIIPNNHTGFAINPALNTPMLPIQHQNFYDKDFIAVYPDVIRGNPFQAKHVVRYLLAPRGAYGGDEVFPDTDQIWGALPTIADNVLRLPVSDRSIFYRPDGIFVPEGPPDYGFTFSDHIDREGSCFYSHKYEMHGNQPLLGITGSSTRLTGSLKELANTLRKSKVCYVYEVTSVLTEAALCGCPVVLVRTPYFNTIDPACMMGDVRWNDGEIVKECANYLPEYLRFVENFQVQLRHFISKTKELL